MVERSDFGELGRAAADRRRHVRVPLATAVGFYHGPSGRQFPARSVDVSAGGMLVYLPASTPVLPGQPVKVTIPRQTRPELARLPELPVSARIVRVDRRRLLDIGYLPVGVEFAAEPQDRIP